MDVIHPLDEGHAIGDLQEITQNQDSFKEIVVALRKTY